MIIAEKPIAAERIAEILSGGKKKTFLNRGVECHELDGSIVIPMKGHILEVDFPESYRSWQKTELGALVDAPVNYEPNQKQIADVISEVGKSADELVIATDYDREGESIGKEAVTLVTKVNPRVKIMRAKFSAITQTDLDEAFSKLSAFDDNLADSADSRREIDLIWGAVLTRLMSLSAGRLGNSYLSVGRVQTPVLSIIVDREKEIKAFKPEPYWTVFLECMKGREKFLAFYEEDKLFDKKKADSLLGKKHDSAKVKALTKKEMRMKPPTPFNTTEFMRAAALLGYQPSNAMRVAEGLYMNGYISYPRTDNTVYPKSLDIRALLQKFAKTKEFGDMARKLLQQKELVATEGKRKSTDHPPIHPVEIPPMEKLGSQEKKIYALVVHRFLATLGKDSVIETLKVDLDYGGENFVARGKIVLDEGWREYYPYSKTEDVILPKLAENETVAVDGIKSEAKETKPKPRWSAAALIKEMENLNLGTKATRAEIIQKLINRGYVKGRSSFIPSEFAYAVIESLEKYSKGITKPEMTAQLEEEMNLVEKGEKKKDEVVGDSRNMLMKVLNEMLPAREEIGKTIKSAISAEKNVGPCPSCGKELRIIRTRRGTRFVGCSGYKDGCRTGFPLPRFGNISVIRDKTCDTCHMAVIEVKYPKRRPFTMCINHQCASKADWGKKKKEKEAAKAAAAEQAQAPTTASSVPNVPTAPTTPAAKPVKEKKATKGKVKEKAPTDVSKPGKRAKKAKPREAAQDKPAAGL